MGISQSRDDEAVVYDSTEQVNAPDPATQALPNRVQFRATRTVRTTNFMLPLTVRVDAEGEVSITPLESPGILKRVDDFEQSANGCTIIQKLELCGGYNPLAVDITIVLRGLDRENDTDIVLPKLASGAFDARTLYCHRADMPTIKSFGNLRVAANRPYTTVNQYQPQVPAASGGSASAVAPADTGAEVTLPAGEVTNSFLTNFARAHENAPDDCILHTNTFMYQFLSKYFKKHAVAMPGTPVGADRIMLPSAALAQARAFIDARLIQQFDHVKDLNFDMSWKSSEEELQGLRYAVSETRPTAEDPIIVVLSLNVTYVYCSKILYV